MQYPSREYQHYVKFLFDLQFFGIKLGLENIRALLKVLGNPHRNFPIIHIAGTNGKGSTAAMIASILTVSGYRTGLYTSPHLIRFNERIRIDGKQIHENDIVSYTKFLRKEIVNRKATFFEATTAMAFQYFSDQKVDVAVVETGLGGRFDATNIVNPLVSIITSIGLDHMELLGNSLSEIAYEKGGIIKPGVPCILGINEISSNNVIRQLCRENHSTLVSVLQETKLRRIQSSLAGSTIDISTSKTVYKNLSLSLPGIFQLQNVRTAIVAVEYLRATGLFPGIREGSIRKALANIREFSGMHGRIDVLQSNPLVIGDVAHNPAAIEALCTALAELCFGELIIVFGVMRDKDIHSIFNLLSGFGRLVIAVQPETDRALEAGEIINNFHARGQKAILGGNVEGGIELALKEYRSNDIILAIGSHHVVGETMKYFQK